MWTYKGETLRWRDAPDAYYLEGTLRGAERDPWSSSARASRLRTGGEPVVIDTTATEVTRPWEKVRRALRECLTRTR
jgi:hypothetical protein